MKKICQNCGVEFNASESKTKYCSKKCFNLKRIKRNKITIKKDYAIIHTKSKRHGEQDFFINLEDVNLVKDITWRADGYEPHIYARAWINGKNIRLHRYLLNPPKNKVIDHIDRNTRNNKRSNLRICSTLDNGQNKSMYKTNNLKCKNIHYAKYSNKYHLQIRRKGISFSKYFNSIDDAIKERELFFKNNPQYIL